MPVTIDPRRYDAVIFGLDAVVTDVAAVDAAACSLSADGETILADAGVDVVSDHRATRSISSVAAGCSA